MVDAIIGLLVVFQAKHWLCDYPLQTPWMLRKFRSDWSYVLPLAAHAGTHGVCTLAIATAWCWTAGLDLGLAGQCAAVDFVVHFVMDRIKASPRLLGRFKPLGPEEFSDPRVSPERHQSNRLFWWFLGVDQMVHHLTHYWVIVQLVTGFQAIG